MNKIPYVTYIVRLVMARLDLINLIYYHISFSDASHRKNRRMIFMLFDKILNHKETKGIVREKGWDGFLDHMGEEEETSFFSCSTFWYEDEKYICKFKGAKRDMVVGWEGVHSVKFTCNHCGANIETGLSCPNGCTDF